MAQESRSRRRSFGYRQLMSCEDPRGVVESGTIRKPKTAQKLKSDGRKQKNVEGKGILKKEMSIGGVEETKTRTSLQLLEVSREAQKLNHVISCWSADHSRNNSRDVAQDMLKGALHLGESLAVLTRLQQQSSNYLSESTKKQEKQKTKPPSNVVAKLMGLEDASLRSLSYDPRKDMGEGDKILNKNRPVFDVDSPRAKRRPTLDEMIEAVKLRGLPTSSLLKGYDVDSDDRPPIVILKPSWFSCLGLEQPIIGEDVFDEMIRGMRIRTNPLAQTDECGPVNYNVDFGKAVKGKPEAASSLGKSRPHRKQLVENNAEESHKDQRYRDASQIDITVADYDDDDQSFSSETPYGKGRQSSTIDLRSVEGGDVCPKDEKWVYSVCEHHTNDNQSPSCRVDSSLGISQSGATRHIEEQEKSVYTASAPCIDKLKALLLSNPPFIKHVEELFDWKVSPKTYLLQQADHGGDHNYVSVSASVLLDTATELMGLHSFRCSRAFLPYRWTTYHKTSYITRYSHSSLEQLVDEVCDEIEALRCNSQDEGDDHSTDSLLLLVKGDWRSTGMVGGMWDMGWTSAGLEDQSEEITIGVGELVLDGLIEEILVDLTLNIKFPFFESKEYS